MKKLLLTIIFCSLLYSDGRADSSLSTQHAELMNSHVSELKTKTIKHKKENYRSHKEYTVLHNNVGPRPFAWCGWFMRTLFGGGPEYNVAKNWANRGRPTKPQVGAVVVWPHHVGYIVGKTTNGQWIIKSGNDGNAVRERPQSVAGAIAFRSL